MITEEIKQVYKEFQLGNSKFISEVIFNKQEYLTISVDEQESIVQRQLIKQFSEYVLLQKPIIQERIHPNGNKIFSKELIVLEMNEFKNVIEATIKLIPIDVINKIKNS
jgi:hypothetical protein